MPNNYNANNANLIAAALQKAGLSGNKLSLALAQVAHETGGFTNAKIKTHNNASGITFINNPTKQKNAKQGNPLPESPKYHYAKFDTLNDWAKDYMRIVGSALNSSSSADEYAKKLASKKYYEVSSRYPNAVANYSKNLQYWLGKIKTNVSNTITDHPFITVLPLLIVGAIIYLIKK